MSVHVALEKWQPNICLRTVLYIKSREGALAIISTSTDQTVILYGNVYSLKWTAAFRDIRVISENDQWWGRQCFNLTSDKFYIILSSKKWPITRDRAPNHNLSIFVSQHMSGIYTQYSWKSWATVSPFTFCATSMQIISHVLHTSWR